MTKYIIQNLKMNIRKFIIMLIMLTICSVVVLFTLEIILNLINEMESSWIDLAAQDDLKSMIFMLECGIALLIGFVILIANNTYSVILLGRENEFNLLHRLGFCRNRIRRMLFWENLILCGVALIIGIILSNLLSLTFMDRFDLKEPQRLPLNYYFICGLGMLLVIFYIVNKNFKNMSIGLEKKKTIYGVNKKQIMNRIIWTIVGTVISIVCFTIPEQVYQNLSESYGILLQGILFIIGLTISLEGSVILVLMILLKFAERNHFNAIYLAAKQNLFNLKKIKSIISSIIIAVSLFVGFQGLYDSIRETTRVYIKESVNYDTLVFFDTMPRIPQEELINLLEGMKDDNKDYSLTLTLIMTDARNHNLTLTGIDESYYKMQKFYVMDNGDINRIYDENENLLVMFSSKAAANQEWTIGNIVADYNYNESPFAFEIGVLYKPINLNQAFTSKKVLSKRLYGTEDKYNAIYLSGYTKEEIDQIMNYFKNDVYSIYDMEAYTQECIDQAINGTEMIEIILYVSMLFVTSLVINLFILSYSDRKKQYSELMILGIKKFDLLKSMLIESGMVYLIGTGIGYIVAIPFIKGALCIVKEALIFDTIIHIPYRLISGIIVGCFLVILLFTFIIGVYTLNTDEFNNNNE